MTKKLLMGNQAFACAALEAGVRVAAGYPGTPSSEVIETIAARHADGSAKGVHVEWSTNEKAALELLSGASYAGARTLFTCKQMGMNVAADPLLSVNYVGTGGGMVLFVADDPGPISSQTEQDTRRFAAFAKVPVLDPATPEQGAEMIKAAFDLSEKYHTPVIVRPTTRVCHASAFFEVEDETQARPVPEEGFVKDPKWIIFPRRSYQAHAEINERLEAIAADFGEDPALAQFNVVFEGGASSAGATSAADGPDGLAARIAQEAAASAAEVAAAEADPDFDDILGLDPNLDFDDLDEATFDFDPSVPRLGIMAGGVSASYVRDALAMLEERAAELGVELPAYRFMQVGTPFPFPRKAAADFASGLGVILVFEELDYVIEDEMLKLAGEIHADYDVLGKLTGHTRARGENDVDDCLARLAAFFDAYAPSGLGPVFEQLVPQGSPYAYLAPDDQPLPVRPPVLCAGCPHRGSFYAVKRALGKREAIYSGDIGCYTLGNAAPLYTTDTCLCMGAGITMAQGFAVADPAKKQVAFVGDSTFFASGMTGSQPHPGTGVTLMGPKRKPISIPGVLEALGVEKIVRANPLDHEQAKAAAAEAIDFEGPSAIVFESPCIQLKRPDAPVVVNPDTCTGCRKCVTEIGCPALGFDPDATGPASKGRGQAFVDTSLCNGCGLCTSICPFGSIALPAKSAAAGETPAAGATPTAAPNATPEKEA